ncbi:hypothetical protein JG687_00003894 [Phytophthora cactorum]|uniref:Uncharacterized protein n=1 Tax=Phytophthora cactorum TaxID=29920 RepID=A0A329SAG6_9STRA|nr:hypothetical protein JG687_00003894 [Phytophthora cactorum]RAW33827.1 hypothetical protein PC110_g9864 [Phytophthora cactorum]
MLRSQALSSAIWLDRNLSKLVVATLDDYEFTLDDYEFSRLAKYFEIDLSSRCHSA